MKYSVHAVIIMTVAAMSAFAQDTTNSAKLDTIMFYQKKSVEQQEQIFNEVVRYKEPLENKNYGIELNPSYLLTSISQSYVVISGGFSFFSIDRNAEIALPLFVQLGTSEKGSNSPLTLLNMDIVYRRFLGEHQDGFYLEGGLRYTHMRGELDNGFSIFGLTLFSISAPIITTDKIGAMFGIGYRFFSSSGFYWGAGIKYGTYLSDDERGIKGVFSDDTKTILDVEILKFGFAF